MPVAAPLDHVTAVLSLLARLGWNRHEGLESDDPTMPVKPVYVKVLSAKHPFPCLKCIVGPTWVTYYKLVGDHTYDMDSVLTRELGTVESVLSELTARNSPSWTTRS